MIIIEGPDLAGKSTFAKAIAKKLELEYCHLDKPGPDFHGFLGYMDLIDPEKVWDRFHISEPVYAHHANRPVIMSPDQCQFVQALLKCVGCFTVIIEVGETLQRARWREGEMYDLDTNIAVARDYKDISTTFMGAYHSRGKQWNFDVDRKFKAEYVQENFDECVDFVISEWVKRQERVRIACHPS
jgi:thymidylate kinase